jgi:hypothetical protein
VGAKPRRRYGSFTVRAPGAWLGFHATEGLFALITAIVGAAVGGNLILLALDIAWDWQLRDRFRASQR